MFTGPILRTAYDEQQYIRDLLLLQDDDEIRLSVSHLSLEHAQKVFDEVWKVVDSTALPLATADKQIFAYKTRLRTLSLHLCLTHSLLPSALTLAGVTCTDTENLAGTGSFADVFEGKYRNERVALKRVRLPKSDTNKAEVNQLLFRECILWKALVHPHIVPFIGVDRNVFPGSICMVIKWMENGSLSEHMETLRRQGELKGGKHVEAVERWLLQTADGLSYMHDEGLIHGDLHGKNILVDKDGTACLTDLGRTLTSEPLAYGKLRSLHGGGALRWTAPELLDPEPFGVKGTRATRASDIFSYACVIIELYSGQVPMPDLTAFQVSHRYVQGIRPPKPVTPDGIDMGDALWSLTQSCWSQTPADRLSAQEIVATLTASLPAKTSSSLLGFPSSHATASSADGTPARIAQESLPVGENERDPGNGLLAADVDAVETATCDNDAVIQLSTDIAGQAVASNGAVNSAAELLDTHTTIFNSRARLKSLPSLIGDQPDNHPIQVQSRMHVKESENENVTRSYNSSSGLSPWDVATAPPGAHLSIGHGSSMSSSPLSGPSLEKPVPTSVHIADISSFQRGPRRWQPRSWSFVAILTVAGMAFVTLKIFPSLPIRVYGQYMFISLFINPPVLSFMY
ncbi:hypothetical protein EIP91_004622 [Steccherinum ochraceum]|uniref:Protein kinase domain-containing protein n=1 Tax=Steccherinum ochraceum TaxID=92696 RepID=A0A4R0RSG3_9APHY|nr:hypothetical protein EIP91_004622 [Steccherinum ochraceum]